MARPTDWEKPIPYHRRFRALDQDLAGKPRSREQGSFVLRCRVAEQVRDQLPEAPGEDHAEAVRLVDQLPWPTIVGQRCWKLELERIERVPWFGSIVIGNELLDSVREILSRGLHEVAFSQVRRHGQ